MVSQASIIMMGVAVAFVVAAAILLPIFIRKRFHADIPPYFIGCAVFVIFALVLESIMHNVVFAATGNAIIGNKWLYALYGGFAAGIFEESGRYLAMRTVLKKHHVKPHNALMYGAGHGCVEAVLLVGITMVENIVFAIFINAGRTEVLLSTTPAEQQEALRTIFTQLIDLPAYTYLLTMLERVSSVTIHISLSVLVWTAAVKKKTLFFPLAILIHALYDGVFVVLQQSGVNNYVLEVLLLVITAITAVLIYLLIWKKYLADSVLPQEEEATV